jgi:hypothetical protein
MPVAQIADPGRAFEIRMTYRDDLQAARMRRDVLARELHQVRSRMDEFDVLARQAEALERELAQTARDLDQARARVALPMLQRVRVASPCKERWDDMTGDEHVRFCGRCEKNVYDLSSLTASQAESLLRERGESMCVRFFRRSDGTILTSDCPVGARKRFWRRAATAAVATGLAAAGITMAATTCATTDMGKIEPMMGEPAIEVLGQEVAHEPENAYPAARMGRPVVLPEDMQEFLGTPPELPTDGADND